MIELYQVQPSEFVRARNALAARLRKAGRTAEATDVAKLRRPTPILWAVNHVAHQQPGEVKQLIEATDALKMAQLGRRKDVDAATTRQRNALQNLVTRAAAALQSVGLAASPAVLRRVSATLLGAAADPRARPQLREGRLTEELLAPGFEVFGGMTPRERPASLAARQQVRKLEREARRRRSRADRTEKAVGALRRRLQEVDARLAQERRQADEAEQRAAKAREQLTRAGANRGP